MKFRIDKNQVHIWQADLAHYTTKISEFWQLLSEREKQRAERFKFDEHRQNFIVSKAILRKILASYVQVSPAEIQFGENVQGKPYLQYPAQRDIFFNTSHSHARAIYAIARHQEVGIDIEYMQNRHHDLLEIAERFFSPEENKDLQNLQKAEKFQAFFRGWTRKEAVIKAMGFGMSYPCNQFSVNIAAKQSPQKVIFQDVKQQKIGWRVYDLMTVKSFAAALGVAGKVELCYFEFVKPGE